MQSLDGILSDREIIMEKGSVNIRKENGKHMRILQRKAASLEVVLLIFLLPLLASCKDPSVSDTRFVLGTVCTITVNGTDDESLLDSAFDLLYSIDHAISRYDEGSYVYRINESAGKEGVSVPPGIFSLIERSLEMAERTDGVFNPAIGPLTALWGIGTESARVPDESEIERVLPLLDYHDVVLSEEDHSVFLGKEGMALDLGAVGKGWASDLVRDHLLSLGVRSALINLGGNITAIGRGSDGKPWRIGIQRPFGDAGSFFTIVGIGDESIVTSGGYQRYIEEGGVMYHHILSSETGYPAKTDLLSASVISEDGTLADILSTTLFASGLDRAPDIVRAFGVRAVLLTSGLDVIELDAEEGEVAVNEE